VVLNVHGIWIFIDEPAPEGELFFSISSFEWKRIVRLEPQAFLYTIRAKKIFQGEVL
jgi:hypothetical protein